MNHRARLQSAGGAHDRVAISEPEKAFARFPIWQSIAMRSLLSMCLNDWLQTNLK